MLSRQKLYLLARMVEQTLDVPGAVAAPVRTMPLRQLAPAADVAPTVTFLASDAARHISGEAVLVAGGMEGRALWSAAELDEDAIRARTRG